MASAMVWGGVALLIHAAFSAVHYKELAAAAGMELGPDFLPLDVKVETVLGVVVAIAGALANAGKLNRIDGSEVLNKVTWDKFWDNTNFRLYNHRAKALRERLAKQ